MQHAGSLAAVIVDGDDGGRVDLPWGAVLVGFGLLLVVLIALLAVRSSRRSRAARPETDRSATLMAAQVLAEAQWLHDHLSLAVLAGPGAEAQQRWVAERPRVETLARNAYGVAVDAREEVADVWIRLATAANTLASVLDGACARRAADAPDDEAPDDGAAADLEAVEGQRKALRSLIEQGRAVLTAGRPAG